jgi:[ribosomal protein S18]-alanine N-acetyltransferase
MSLLFRPMDEANARAFLSWRYDAPYDFYNIPASAVEYLSFFTDPHNTYYSISSDDGTLEAFCCFGADAQVPGGDYSADALNVGLGIRPDLTGQGHGDAYLAAILAFARQTFAPTILRTTVAEWNTRSQRLWVKAGFQPIQVFPRAEDGMPFVLLIRET